MNRLGTEKLIYHVDRFEQIKESGDTYPVHMVVGVTDYCNHRCIFCNSDFATADTTKVDAIDKEVLLRFLKEASECGLKAVTICGSGEPLIYPEMTTLLYAIHDLGIDIGIFTNGYKLDSDMRKAILDTCTFVRCSINASNQEEHENVHQVKGQFSKIVDNVRCLVVERNNQNQKLPTIGTQFVFYDKNYSSMVEATKLWKEVGVDYFEIKPLIEGEGSNVGKTVFAATNVDQVLSLMKEAKGYETEKFAVYTKINQYLNTIKEGGRPYKKCYGHALDPNLWSDGNMFICSNQEHDKDVIGNIYENSFKEIWHGDRRKKRIEEIDVSKCPRGCRCDPINEVIWEYLNPDEEVHINFI